MRQKILLGGRMTSKNQKKKIINTYKKLIKSIIENAHINIFGCSQSIEQEKYIHNSMCFIAEDLHIQSGVDKNKIIQFIKREIIAEELQILLNRQDINIKEKIELRLW